MRAQEKRQKMQLKNLITGLVLVLICFTANANIGGEFYDRSIAGLSIDTSQTVLSAETKIECEDSTCTFRTVYKVSASEKEFRGQFYGIKYTSLRVNGHGIPDSLLSTDTLVSDSVIFGRNWVLEEGPLRTKVAAVPIVAPVGEDSCIVVEGRLHPSRTMNWGMAAFSDMISLRHPLLQKPKVFKNEFVVSYVLAPIQSFDGLQKISLKIKGNNVEIRKRKWHRRMNDLEYQDFLEESPWAESFSDRNKDSTTAMQAANDSVTFVDKIPDVIEYFYALPGLEKKRTWLSLGGPILYLGGKSKRLYSEIGWEFGINPIEYLTILPSGMASFTPDGYSEWSAGLRAFFMGYSLGLNTREFKDIGITFGIDVFGPVGIEFRNNAILGKLSI